MAHEGTSGRTQLLLLHEPTGSTAGVENINREGINPLRVYLYAGWEERGGECLVGAEGGVCRIVWWMGEVWYGDTLFLGEVCVWASGVSNGQILKLCGRILAIYLNRHNRRNDSTCSPKLG